MGAGVKLDTSGYCLLQPDQFQINHRSDQTGLIATPMKIFVNLEMMKEICFQVILVRDLLTCFDCLCSSTIVHDGFFQHLFLILVSCCIFHQIPN